jgi:hypothetical protein
MQAHASPCKPMQAYASLCKPMHRRCAAHGACASPFEAALLEMLPLASLEQETLRLLLSGLNELTGQTRLLAQV